MKVTVKDNFLNVRVGKPSVNAPCYQYIAPGSIIEVDGKLYKGDKYGDSGIDTWLKDEAGNYYWSGGVDGAFSKTTNIDSSFQSVIDASYDGHSLKTSIDYKALLKVDEKIKAAEGENITIGILDHPLSFSFNSILRVIRPFYIGDPLFNFHANFIAGIIGGTKNILGIAKKCTLLELPIYNARATSSGIDIEKVLNFINNRPQPMIINISNGMDEKYNDLIRNLKQDKIIVACAGIDEELAAGVIRNPASQSNVIAVGAINKKPSLLPKLNSKIDFLVPNYNYVSFDKNDETFAKEQGDSFACAVVSATIALLISSGKATFDRMSIKKELVNISELYSADPSFDSFKIINTNL